MPNDTLCNEKLNLRRFFNKWHRFLLRKLTDFGTYLEMSIYFNLFSEYTMPEKVCSIKLFAANTIVF